VTQQRTEIPRSDALARVEKEPSAKPEGEARFALLPLPSAKPRWRLSMALRSNVPERAPMMACEGADAQL
jgi:hypothetical protein